MPSRCCGANDGNGQPAEPHVYTEFDAWVMQFALFVQHKGKVEPGQCRAYGYEAPSHRWADIKLKWREIRNMPKTTFRFPPWISDGGLMQLDVT